MTDEEMSSIESDVDRMMDKIESATVSKAILELDMPDRCGHCRLSSIVKYYATCMVTGLECTEGGKPDWCPLKPVGGVPISFGTGKAYMMTKLEDEYE